MFERFAVLIGDPVVHSRSPVLHNAAFQHLGITATYDLWHTPAPELPSRIAALRTPKLLGANVTLPHKSAVIPLLDALEPEAAQIGAVNTIYKRSDDFLVGANTDAPAFLEDLRTVGEFDPTGKHAVILGASGAARAAAYALVNAKVGQLTIINRTLQRADSLADNLRHNSPSADVRGIALDDRRAAEAIADCTLLVNATSLGWHANETPYPDPPVSSHTFVYDMVYRPTQLLHDAEVRGARTLHGLGMLVRQGALAFTRWTGLAAPLDVMFQAVQPE